ncbi:MAG TPA: TIGR03885 family FMN-dependent LLM class oxidoreductase [Pseudolysinimonas sp.]|nr:TIGR03885 family FMN-dependent LLM class oxidoreductase [Pseudolysinimonas sp.]
MTLIGYHCSHENVPPDELLTAAQAAEHVGFDAAMCSDHFAPWGERQGESGFAWSWLGAALATTRFTFGLVTAPGQRYHPAIVAQAIATLGLMFPGRFWAALGSGEAINEHITGDPWPSKDVREERLLDSVEIIRDLLDGEEVSRDGLIPTHRARLWSRPEVPPRLVGAAVTAETAARAAAWADGLITVVGSHEQMQRVIGAYRDAGGQGPCVVQVHLSWAPSDDEAVAIALEQWRHGPAVRPPETWDIADPEEFDRRARDVDEAAIRGALLVEHEPARLAERVAEIVGAGFDGAYLHHVGRDQVPFLTMAGAELLPALRELLPEVES